MNTLVPVILDRAQSLKTMSRWCCCLSLLVASLNLAACQKPDLSKAQTPTKDVRSQDLTLNEWKDLQDPEKFDPSILKRIRKQDPALKDNHVWKKFYDEVYVPTFKQEFGEQAQPPRI